MRLSEAGTPCLPKCGRPSPSTVRRTAPTCVSNWESRKMQTYFVAVHHGVVDYEAWVGEILGVRGAPMQTVLIILVAAWLFPLAFVAMGAVPAIVSGRYRRFLAQHLVGGPSGTLDRTAGEHLPVKIAKIEPRDDTVPFDLQTDARVELNVAA